DRTLAVDRLAERVDDAAEETLADGDAGDPGRTADLRAFLDIVAGAHQYDPDVILLEVEYDGFDATLKLDQLPGLCLVEAVDAGDTVPYLEDRADLLELGCALESGQLLLEDRGNFIGFYIYHDAMDLNGCSKWIRRRSGIRDR